MLAGVIASAQHGSQGRGQPSSFLPQGSPQPARGSSSPIPCRRLRHPAEGNRTHFSPDPGTR